MGAKLREEDLVPGKAWVHPGTYLEYEDFHAYFAGKDPLPHQRNAYIKQAWRINVAKGHEHLREQAARAYAAYDRDGAPPGALTTSRFSAAIAGKRATLSILDDVVDGPVY